MEQKRDYAVIERVVTPEDANAYFDCSDTAYNDLANTNPEFTADRIFNSIAFS